MAVSYETRRLPSPVFFTSPDQVIQKGDKKAPAPLAAIPPEVVERAINGSLTKEDLIGVARVAQYGPDDERRAAFSIMFGVLQSHVLRRTRRMMGNREDGEDLVQEVFIRAFKKLPQALPDTSEHIGSWLNRIATNTCIDAIRHRNSVKIEPLTVYQARTSRNLEGPETQDPKEPLEVINPNSATDTPLTDTNPEDVFLKRESVEELRRRMSRLLPSHCQVLELKYFKNLSYKEIAERMGRTPTAVKLLLFRARKEMAAKVGELLYDNN